MSTTPRRFVDHVVELLEEYKVPPRCMEIELTETVLQTGQGTIETLRRLRELGISVALDDFGAGYSSLASLEQLPLTRVKLDRSLIATIDSSARSLAIARSIIDLCASLDLEVTAEGLRVLKVIRTKRTAWLSARLSALADVDLTAIADAIAPLEALLVQAE